MSLTGALNAARSGMNTTSRWAQTTSNNIANASNASYARRSTVIGSNAAGGVSVSEISRAVSSSLDTQYRQEVSRTATQDAIASGLSLYGGELGDTQSGNTLLTRLTDLQGSLTLAAATPSESGLQRAAVTDAQELATQFNSAWEKLSTASGDALAGINRNVSDINGALSELAELNAKLASGKLSDSQNMALGDEMTEKLDALAEKMDFTMRTDAKGRMEIFTTGGTALLQGETVSDLSFNATTGILSAGEVEITPNITGVRGISEGSLAGQITLYNDIIPEMSAQLDQAAEALVRVVQEADGSLASGEAGLFTDAGGALGDPVEPGLAGRIAVNSAVLPEEGGALWRLRDGMAATTEGEANDATQLNAYISALETPTDYDSSVGLDSEGTLGDYLSALIAGQNSTRATAETAAETFAAGAMTVQETRLGFMGVNVDDELQQLVSIEQAYAANAQAMSTVLSMLDTLIETF